MGVLVLSCVLILISIPEVGLLEYVWSAGFALGIAEEILFALFLRAKRLERKARSNAQKQLFII